MQAQRKFPETLWRVVLPLVAAVLLVTATALVSGSYLFTIEDVTLNRVVAGTSGAPDWRVQGMNPLLSQALTLCYRVIPAVNWYGVLLLSLLAGAVALLLSLTARKRGALLPALLALAPLAVLSTYSLMSSVVCALCAGAGAFALLDGLSQKPHRAARAVVGGVLFAFSAMLSLPLAAALAVAAALCYLPGTLREHRARGLLRGVPALAVILAALFGYSALMYASPELSAYRADYAAYEALQHSDLAGESDALMVQYGSNVSSPADAPQDTGRHGLVIEAEPAITTFDQIPETVFDTVGWNLNDAMMFFIRNGTDTGITDAESIRTLLKEAARVDFSLSPLLSGLFTTVKKPQFLLLIGLLLWTALTVVATNRRKWFAALLAVVFALGGHIAALAAFRDSFAEIAPFYLLAICAMLYHLDGEAASGWLARRLPKASLRAGAAALAAVVLVAGTGGLLLYFGETPEMARQQENVRALAAYFAENPDTLFIGDSPYDRVKPSSLEAPERGADQNLLLGTYDLYSPRRARLMEQYGLSNPLPDSLDREDIVYLVMSFTTVFVNRLADTYGTHLAEAEPRLELPDYAGTVVPLRTLEEETPLAEEAPPEEEAPPSTETEPQATAPAAPQASPSATPAASAVPSSVQATPAPTDVP